MKSLSILTILFLLLSSGLKAKPGVDTLVYYLDERGVIMNTREGFEIVRMVYKQKVDDKFYVVKEFYNNGQIRAIGQSKLVDGRYPVGNRLEYSMTGQRRTFVTFDNFGLMRQRINYFPNGQIYTVYKYSNTDGLHLEECRDSTGKVLAENGTGTQVIYNDLYVDSGAIAKGKRNGEWQRKLKNQLIASMMYENDALTVGTGFDANGEQHQFDKVKVLPKYKSGEIDFNDYIKRRVKLTSELKKSKPVLRMTFDVDANGKIQDVSFIDAINDDLRTQVTDIVNSSEGSWTPGREYGVIRKMQVLVALYF